MVEAQSLIPLNIKFKVEMTEKNKSRAKRQKVYCKKAK